MPNINRVSSLTFALVIVASFSARAEQNNSLDGARLYQEHCVACHGLGVFIPTPANMSKLTSEEVYETLWFGSMAEIANGLEDAERLALAEYIGSMSIEKPNPDSGARSCEGPPAASTDAWTGWAPDLANTRYLPKQALTAAKLKGMNFKWAFAFPDASPFVNGGNQVTVSNGRLFTGNLNRWVYALDADRGCAHWTFRADARVRSAVVLADGVALVADTLAHVYGLDAETGKLLWKVRADPQASARIIGSMTAYQGTVFVPISSMQEVYGIKPGLSCCSFRGSVVALDVKTGRRVWRTSMIDEPLRDLGKAPNGDKRYGPSGVTVWSVPTIDTERGLIYIATGNQFTEPRVAESDAIIALDIKTGAKRWIQTLAPEQFNNQDIYHIGCEAWVNEKRETCSPVNPKGEGDRDFGAPAVLQRTASGRDSPGRRVQRRHALWTRSKRRRPRAVADPTGQRRRNRRHPVQPGDGSAAGLCADCRCRLRAPPVASRRQHERGGSGNRQAVVARGRCRGHLRR